MNFKGSYLKNEFCYDLQVRNPDDLDDSVFNCTRLPTCAITCEGPYQKILKQSTKESGCMIEWFIHSEWLQLTTAFLVFISLKKIVHNVFLYTSTKLNTFFLRI